MSEEIRNQVAEEAAVEEVEVSEETLNEQRRIRREKLKALQEAVKADKRAFSCPICGGTVKWSRCPENGHIHAGCDRCGIMCAE